MKFRNLYWISGRKILPYHRSRLMLTFQDRIRIPWRGGAKQVPVDTILPVVLVPLMLNVAAYDLLLTIIVFCLLPMFLNYGHVWFKRNLPRTKFFIVWSITSLCVIAFIFEKKVISLLEILPEENIALAVLTLLFVLLVYLFRLQAAKDRGSGDVEENAGGDFCTTCKKKTLERMHHCSVCQICVPERDYHMIWADCCIGQSNRAVFILSLIFGISALLYSSNLTLTSICHPFVIFGTILLPDDCSEVYEQYDLSMCFVSAIYSIIIAVYFIWLLIRHCVMMSKGFTGQEWRQLPLIQRVFCGKGAQSRYSKGFWSNCRRNCCPGRT